MLDGRSPHAEDVEDVSSGVCIVQMQRSYIDDRQNACMALLRFFFSCSLDIPGPCT